MAKTLRVVAPAGMTGLACEPWSKGEVYAVAADWAQASSPVMVYGEDGWTWDEHGRQVADFQHSPRAALEAVLAEAVAASGDHGGEWMAKDLAADAVELVAPVVCPVCGEVNELADEEGYTEEYPREMHAACARKVGH